MVDQDLIQGPRQKGPIWWKLPLFDLKVALNCFKPLYGASTRAALTILLPWRQFEFLLPLAFPKNPEHFDWIASVELACESDGAVSYGNQELFSQIYFLRTLFQPFLLRKKEDQSPLNWLPARRPASGTHVRKVALYFLNPVHFPVILAV